MGELQKQFKRLKQANNAVIKKMSREIGKTIAKEYVSAIEKFYNDYTPIYYQRGYNLYKANSAIYNGSYKKISQSHYIAGITADSDYIGANTYNQDTDLVFDITYNKGIHGTNRNFFMQRGWEIQSNIKSIPKNMIPPPHKIVQKKYRELVKKDYLSNMYNTYMENWLSKNGN